MSKQKDDMPVDANQKALKPKGPDDEAFYQATFVEAPIQLLNSLPMRKGPNEFNPTMYHIRYFRQDEIAQYAAQLEAGHWTRVTREGCTAFGDKFSDWFEDRAFNCDDSIAQITMDIDTKKPIPEQILYCQPMGAKKASQRIKEERWDKITGPDSANAANEKAKAEVLKKVESAPGHRKGTVKMIDADIGADTPGSWADMK